MRRFLIWHAVDGPRVEASAVEVREEGLRASGVQVGDDPLPYRLDYRLDATDGWRTRRLEIVAVGEDWRRTLALTRDGGGRWAVDAHASGEADLPEPGGAAERLDEALDCDLGFSPLTNAMPVRRQGLLAQPGVADFVMAWVAVPELAVTPSAQRYEHVRRTDDGAVVRYVDRGLFEGFTAELEFDRDGLVRLYPELAIRSDAR